MSIANALGIDRAGVPARSLCTWMYGMPITPKAPTVGAGAIIGDTAIAEKAHF